MTRDEIIYDLVSEWDLDIEELEKMNFNELIDTYFGYNPEYITIKVVI